MEFCTRRTSTKRVCFGVFVEIGYRIAEHTDYEVQE